jgi:tight adherence protein B
VNAIVPACLALVALVVLPPARQTSRRLRALRLVPSRRAPVPSVSHGMVVRRPRLVVGACAVGTAVGAILATAVLAPDRSSVAIPAISGAIAGAMLGHLLARLTAARQLERLDVAITDGVAALAGELRAGQPAQQALRAVAENAPVDEVARLLRTAADTAVVGGDVGDMLRRAACVRARSENTESAHLRERRDRRDKLPMVLYAPLSGLAAAWQVAERTGATPAAVLDCLVEDLRARRRQRQNLAAQLAGARSTAALLAVLPLLGLALGMAMGAHPVAHLLGTPIGQVALLAGVIMDGLGVLWTSRIIRTAGGEP